MPANGTYASYADPEIQPLLKAKLGQKVATTNGFAIIPTLMPIAIGDLVVIRGVFDNITADEPNFDPAVYGGNINVDGNMVGANWQQRFQGASATSGSGIVGVLAWWKATVAVPRGRSIIVQGSLGAPYAVYAELFTSHPWQYMLGSITQGPIYTGGVGTVASIGANAGSQDLVIGMVGYEGYSAFTGDTDGTWSTPIWLPNSIVGTDNTRLSVAGQHKQHQGATALETYDASWLTSTDWMGMCVSFRVNLVQP